MYVINVCPVRVFSVVKSPEHIVWSALARACLRGCRHGWHLEGFVRLASDCSKETTLKEAGKHQTNCLSDVGKMQRIPGRSRQRKKKCTKRHFNWYDVHITVIFCLNISWSNNVRSVALIDHVSKGFHALESFKEHLNGRFRNTTL